jgi:glycosyltransferase involved in cell wall biosynthesis
MKKKIAFLKFAGLASGGIEKYLQTMAVVLKKNGHDVDYYYTNAAPFINSDFVHPPNDENRRQYLLNNNISTYEIKVGYKNGGTIPYTWHDTNIWDVFDPSKYDFIQTGRAGYPEYPFTEIKNTKIVDSIHGPWVHKQENIVHSILLCKWQLDQWVSNGGDVSKTTIIPSLVYVPPIKSSNLRQKYNLKDKFIYGIHQRNDPGIFSPANLQAYKNISNDNNCFVILGGSNKHREYVAANKIPNVYFEDFSSDVNQIHDFLEGIDVYAHARNGGEVCSASIVEAMYHGKPVISIPGKDMGHLEQIDGCGKMCYNLQEYMSEMVILEKSRQYYVLKSSQTKQKYKEKYDFNKIEKDIVDLYETLT